MREIGIMGGTFNPLHTRELMVAQCAVHDFGLDKVLFIPNGTPPHKKVDVLDRESRFEMVEAAVRDNPRFEASRIEIDRPGVTWTIDTLRELKSIYGDDCRLNFICGADVIESMRRYAQRAELLSLCRLLVSPRGAETENALESWRQALPEAEIEMIDCPTSSMSSTIVRGWIRQGRSIRYVVPAAVHDIIARKGHYKEVYPAADEKGSTEPSAGTSAGRTRESSSLSQPQGGNTTSPPQDCRQTAKSASSPSARRKRRRWPRDKKSRKTA